MDPATLLAIMQIIETTAPALINLGTQAVEAFAANDQASLDKIHTQALATANAVRPAGADPVS